MNTGQLFIVATPIGNIGDITYRAVEVLSQVSVIAAEDTRHSRHLLNHYGITTPTMSLHEHNEVERFPVLLKRLLAGDSVALISDAGTPLISDPGYRLVREAHAAGIKVSPIPGPCAAIAALCAGGMPTDRFLFAGFLPAKTVSRKQQLMDLADQPATMVFYESTHRIVSMLEDVIEVMGARQVTLAREITKKFETIVSAKAPDLITLLEGDLNQKKGEFVVLVQGYEQVKEKSDELAPEHLQLLSLLSAELPPKKAAAIVAQLSGKNKRDVYSILLQNRHSI